MQNFHIFSHIEIFSSMDLLCIKDDCSLAIFLFESCLAGRDFLWRKRPWQLLRIPWKCFFLHIRCLSTSHVSSKYYNGRGKSPPYLRRRKWGMEKSLGSDPWGSWAGAWSSILPFWLLGTCHAFSPFQKDWRNVLAAEATASMAAGWHLWHMHPTWLDGDFQA